MNSITKTAKSRRIDWHYAGCGLALAALIFGADQLSKLWILGIERARLPMEILPWLDFTLVWNRGVSYGLLSQSTELGTHLLTALVALIFVGVLVWMVRATSLFMSLTLALIVGGAAGNLLDRILYGAVVDFVHFHVGDWSWYVFNIADTTIVIGAAIVGIQTLFAKDSRD